MTLTDLIKTTMERYFISLNIWTIVFMIKIIRFYLRNLSKWERFQLFVDSYCKQAEILKSYYHKITCICELVKKCKHF